MLREEIGEPASWIIGLFAVTFALAKFWSFLDPQFYLSPFFHAILIGFILHELGHRQVGRIYNMHTELILYIPGLLLTLLTGFVPGIVIIAPGYVRTIIFTPYMRRKAVLYSVAAGPAVNIILALIGALMAPFVSGQYLHGLAYSLIRVNAWLAFFNLLPVPPLDGSKIMRMDRNMWLVMIVASLLFLIYGGL